MKPFSLSQNWWQLLVAAIVCYFIGCFNAALLISRSKHRDITKMGSGNPGTMNMSRELGWKAGLATFVCDALKGGLPAIAAYFLYRGYYFEGTSVVVSDLMRYYCGLFVVIGHIFPVTMKFKGGKGIASTFGLFWCALACENAWWALFMFLFLLGILLFIFFTEWGGLGSLLGVASFSIIQLIFFFDRYGAIPVNAYMVCVFIVIFLINVFTWCAHHKNLTRLFSGEEHRTSLKKMGTKKRREK